MQKVSNPGGAVTGASNRASSQRLSAEQICNPVRAGIGDRSRGAGRYQCRTEQHTGRASCLLGGSSVQLALGGTYRFPRQRLSFVFSLVEDVISNGTPDFALHFSVRGYGGTWGSAL